MIRRYTHIPFGGGLHQRALVHFSRGILQSLRNSMYLPMRNQNATRLTSVTVAKPINA